MSQKKPTSINPAVIIFIIFISTLISSIIGFAINQLESIPDFDRKNDYLIWFCIFLALALAGLSGITIILQDENSTSRGRRLFISLVFTSIGIGGSLSYGGNLKEGWIEAQKIINSNPSPESLPQEPVEVTPKTAEVTPKTAEVTPKAESNPPIQHSAPELAQDSFSFETIEVNERGEALRRESKTTSRWIEDLGEGIQLHMVYIPGGTFQMGSPTNEEGHRDNRQIEEGPQRQITVQPFLMGQYAVTQSQWEHVSKLTRVEIDFRSDLSYFKGALRPVERVTWHEAKEFCDRLVRATGREYRLPTEAEWEYACRANTTTPFYFGETITAELANYDGNYVYGQGSKGQFREQTTDVGQFPPNAYGLFDMHGNLWEWCSDNWVMNGDSFRIIRGGSWFTSPKRCRSANRTILRPDNRGDSNPRDSVGLRVVCVPKTNIF
ncbi:formylglycine-generating enzyme family protein [Leptothoe sp. PORK10 BA2]|uniref:formylglycine-generating enzyme family protein n=1 Tax=Leptothoe sp. PORK10 BA2 TaxID=3110254 RepID=UPI002B22057E|nr:formylglycine-generating enzyme family protein [Leptothoe sp. PORK10 BA2]MEA5467128.1 formylglycine-generating enzyme family protein [Leptothoe sp. PORK10 BA2]